MSNLASIRERWLDPPADDYVRCAECNRLVDSTDCVEVHFDRLLCPSCFEEWVEEQPVVEEDGE